MCVKIVAILLAAFIATPAEGEVWDGFTASWTMNSSSTKFFYTLPQTLEAARNDGWTNISGVGQAHDVQALGYNGDPEFVLLFRDGVVNGLQLGLPLSELHPRQPLQWADNDLIIKKQLNGDQWFYTATAYFRNNESTDTRQIWFQEKTGLREIPTSVAQLVNTTTYKKQKCVRTMGTHYNTLEGSSDCAILNPWTLLGNGDDIIGIDFMGVGTLSIMGVRQWWEDVPRNALYGTMANPPLCVVEAANAYGGISLHIWFLKNPKSLVCG